MNLAAQTILLALKDKNRGVTANSQMLILAPIQLKLRVLAALKVIQQVWSGGQEEMIYNLSPRFSLMLDSSTEYQVILPGQKNVAGIRQDITLAGDTDIVANAELVVGKGRYGGAIGDTDQIEICATTE